MRKTPFQKIASTTGSYTPTPTQLIIALVALFILMLIIVIPAMKNNIENYTNVKIKDFEISEDQSFITLKLKGTDSKKNIFFANAQDLVNQDGQYKLIEFYKEKKLSNTEQKENTAYSATYKLTEPQFTMSLHKDTKFICTKQNNESYKLILIKDSQKQEWRFANMFEKIEFRISNLFL